VRYLIILLVLVLCGCQNRYPSTDDLSRSEGTIHHPVYGDYSEEVEFEQGMTLMPGQTALHAIVIEFPAVKMKDGKAELFNVDELEPVSIEQRHETEHYYLDGAPDWECGYCKAGVPRKQVIINGDPFTIIEYISKHTVVVQDPRDGLYYGYHLLSKDCAPLPNYLEGGNEEFGTFGPVHK